MVLIQPFETAMWEDIPQVSQRTAGLNVQKEGKVVVFFQSVSFKEKCHCMSPVPCAWAVVVLRYCQLSAASSMAADRYTGDRWWFLGLSSDWGRADFSWITARMWSVLTRDGSLRETLCKICRKREEDCLAKYMRMEACRQRPEESMDLLAVLGDDGLHSSHAGGFHHECNGLSFPDLHHTLKHHRVVVTRWEGSYRHHLVGRGIASFFVNEILLNRQSKIRYAHFKNYFNIRK